MRIAKLTKRFKRGQIAIHRENGLGHQKCARPLRAIVHQQRPGMVHIIMAEDPDFSA